MIKLSIATPDRRVIGGIKVKSITVPAECGEITILPGHAPLISTLGIGVLVFEGEDNKREVAAISHGFLQVNQDEVIILADRLELAHEIDLERARRAQEKAAERLKAKETFEEDFEKWRVKLDRSENRQYVAQHLLPPH